MCIATYFNDLCCLCINRAWKIVLPCLWEDQYYWSQFKTTFMELSSEGLFRTHTTDTSGETLCTRLSHALWISSEGKFSRKMHKITFYTTGAKFKGHTIFAWYCAASKVRFWQSKPSLCSRWSGTQVYQRLHKIVEEWYIINNSQWLLIV